MGKADTLNENFSIEENSFSKDVGIVGKRQGNANGSLQSEGRVATGRELSMEWAESVEDRPMACAQIWTIWKRCCSTTSRWVASVGWKKDMVGVRLKETWIRTWGTGVSLE